MSTRAVAIGAAIAACGALVAALPVLPWYRADLPTGVASLSGYAAGGVSWILPVIGAALVVTGLLAAWWRPHSGDPSARALGGVAVLLAALGVGWAALVALMPRVDVVALRAGLPASPLEGDWSVSVMPPAWACLAAAALAGMAGILLVTPGPRGGSPGD